MTVAREHVEDEDAHDDGEDEENREEEDKGEDVHVGHVLNMSSESALEHVFGCISTITSTSS